ncbi:MAG: hypothetical protein IPP91_05820 [Betaproteobacteria bacterium]|nr:hypothetical protein [Betaproteobacteria bacterium]
MRAVLLLLLVSTTALADDAGILRCRAITDSAARLTCYDALVVPVPGAKAATGAPAAAAPQAMPAAATPGSPQPAAAQTPAQFGLEYKTAPAQLDAVESSIPGPVEGWAPGSRITLANGQVWQVTDDSRAVLYLKDPKVRVRRGALGAFYLEIDGTNRSPKVQRVK